MEKIETIEQLAAAYPELVADIHKRGADSVDVKAIKQETASETIATERDRILGLINVQFGEEKGEKLKAVIESGVTVDQFKAIRELNPVKDENTDVIKAEMLEAITNAGADNPGADPNATEEKNYMELVREYQVKHSVDKFEAMRQVNKQYPKAREHYLKKANA